jgi:hypothetical protein
MSARKDRVFRLVLSGEFDAKGAVAEVDLGEEVVSADGARSLERSRHSSALEPKAER